MVFDSADMVELAYIEPRDLINRLSEGKIYKEQQAHKALDSFFTEENLTALREIALRRCADGVNKFSEDAKAGQMLRKRSAIHSDPYRHRVQNE